MCFFISRRKKRGERVFVVKTVKEKESVKSTCNKNSTFAILGLSEQTSLLGDCPTKQRVAAVSKDKLNANRMLKMNDLEKLRKIMVEYKAKDETCPEQVEKLIVFLETNNRIRLEINDFFRV